MNTFLGEGALCSWQRLLAVHNSAVLYIHKQQEVVKVGASRKSFVSVD